MPTRGEVGVVRDPSGMHVPERAISSTEGFDNCRRCHHGRLSKRFFIYAAFAESGGSVRRVGRSKPQSLPLPLTFPPTQTRGWKFREGGSTSNFQPYHPKIALNQVRQARHRRVLETAKPRKSTIHELKIDNALYADHHTRTLVTRLWQSVYKKYPPELHTHAFTYSKAKEETSNLLRQLTRDKKQKLYPTTEIRHEIAQLGLILASRGPQPNLIAKRNQLLQTLEDLERARKRSSTTAYNASQYEERTTKQFFKQFKSGLANADISSIHITPERDNPDSKSGTTDDSPLIVEEFAKYYTHLSRPKPCVHPNTLLDALASKGISEHQKKILDAPITTYKYSSNTRYD
eukprot:scaffold3683_cov118-Isochrysis_galbana.AAC.4